MATTETPQKYSGGNIEPLSDAFGVLLSPKIEEERTVKVKVCRNFVFTSYNKEPPLYDTESMKFLCYEQETCPHTGRLHWQGFVCWKNAKSGKASCNTLTLPGQKPIWNAPMIGTLTQNAVYCSKEGNMEKYGKPPDQGARVDLLEIADRILNHGVSVEDIMIESPHLYHMYGRTMNSIEETRQRRIRRTEAPEVIWYTGRTGCGKSHQAFEGTTVDNSYIFPIFDNGWWDAYRGEEIVIINDFRGEIPYGQLLVLCDKWPNSVKRRGRPPIPFVSKKIIITSVLTPRACYPGGEEDSIDQLLRRIKIVKLEDRTICLDDEDEDA